VAGEFAGLAIKYDDQTAIVPGELLMTMVDRLVRQPHPGPVSLGADVQALTPTLAAALQSPAGVVVTWVDPAGPAAGVLSAMDVVERVNSAAVTSPEQWETQILGLSEGSATVLDVRRQGEARQVRVVAQGKRPAPTDPVLGLTLRTLPRVGAEVLHVLPRSIAARAGIQAGDVITKAGEMENPSSAQIARLFAAESIGESLVVALTRGQDHRVLAIAKER
jgi:S1-C subfamily serine protease